MGYAAPAEATSSKHIKAISEAAANTAIGLPPRSFNDARDGYFTYEPVEVVLTADKGAVRRSRKVPN